MQRDPRNRIRTVKDQFKHMYVDHQYLDDGTNTVQVQKCIGEQWDEGGSYFKAFKNAYGKVGKNMSLFAKE